MSRGEKIEVKAFLIHHQKLARASMAIDYSHIVFGNFEMHRYQLEDSRVCHIAFGFFFD